MALALALQQHTPSAVLQCIWEQLKQRFSYWSCAAAVTGACAAKLLWSQYSVLLTRNLPHYSLELPLLGSTFGMYWHGYVPWSRRMLNQSPAVLTHLLGCNSVMVSWPVYEKYVKKADMDGQLDQGEIPESFLRIIGENSIILMKAGKGQVKHHRLRSKVLTSLTPKRVLAMIPAMTTIITDVLDKMVAETEAQGFSRFAAYADQIPSRITSLPVAGGMPEGEVKRLSCLLDTCISGAFGVPVNLGRFSAYGRALQARKEILALIDGMLRGKNLGGGDVVADLATTTEEGAGFSEGEIVDTVLTLMFAGKFTTLEALPPLLVELALRPDWAEKIAKEPLKMDQLESDSATLRFVREILRHYPPEVLFVRRNRDGPIDLGEYGHVPVGCNIYVAFGDAMWSLGPDFNPDYWTHDVGQQMFLTFGGHSPHSCVGRSMAMVELQLFARLLARSYKVEVLDTTRVRNWHLGGLMFQYKDGCKVRITKK